VNNEQQAFLDDFMANFNMKYPPRYKAGVVKYNSHIVDDYTTEQHIENLEQELFDALAYLHAIRILTTEMKDANNQLNEFVGDL
jgi:hypothetical protein